MGSSQKFGPKNHHRVRVPREFRRFPDDIDRRVTQAVGIAHATIPLVNELARVGHVFQDLQSVVRRLNRLGEGNAVTMALLRAIFFLVLTSRSAGLRTRDGIPLSALYGARGQRELIQMLLATSRHSRKQIASLVDLLEDPREKLQWVANFAGAFAVAQTAYTLHSDGVRVYLPTSAEDVDMKIDLFAVSRGWQHGVCFAIEGNSNHHKADARVLWNPPSERLGLFDFWNGVQRLKERYPEQAWVPVHLVVGRRGETGHDLRHHALRREMERTVRQIQWSAMREDPERLSQTA